MEEKYCNSDSRYDDMQRWFAYLRRHNANFFDVFFKDKEDIADENIIAAILLYIASLILKYASTEFTVIIIGCIFTISFVLLLDAMRKRVGLKPEEYSKKEIL